MGGVPPSRIKGVIPWFMQFGRVNAPIADVR